MITQLAALSLMVALAQMPGCFATETGADPHCKISPNAEATRANVEHGLQASEVAPPCPYVTEDQNEWVDYEFQMLVQLEAYAGEDVNIYLHDLGGQTVLFPTVTRWEAWPGNGETGGASAYDSKGSFLGSTMGNYTVDVGLMESEEPPAHDAGFPIQYTISLAGGPDTTGSLDGGCTDVVTCDYNFVAKRNTLGYRWVKWVDGASNRTMGSAWSIGHPYPMAGDYTLKLSYMRSDWSTYARTIPVHVNIGMPMSNPGTTLYAKGGARLYDTPVGGNGPVTETWGSVGPGGQRGPSGSGTSFMFIPPHSGWWTVSVSGHDGHGHSGSAFRSFNVLCPAGVKTTVIVGGGGGIC